MYSPCFDCLNRYGHSYTEDCDSTCDYANAISKLKPYGGIDEAVKVMSGEAFPLVFVDEQHIDTTYRFVCAAKDEII